MADKARIEIVCPSGMLRGTQVYVDGQKQWGVTEVVLRIAVGETPRLTITRNLVSFDSDGKKQTHLRQSADGGVEVATEVLRFVGEMHPVQSEEDRHD